MASRLKSIVGPRNHRRNPSGVKVCSPNKKENVRPPTTILSGQAPFLPPDHPHVTQKSSEPGRPRDNVRSSPRKSIEVYEDEHRSFGLHKKTKSSVSLKSLMGNDKAKASKATSPEKQDGKKPKKSKSSTSLSALLSRPKSSKGSKDENLDQPKDKENQTPPNTGGMAPPPIWAQFSSQPLEDFGCSTRLPLNDADDLAGEMALYTPQDYSPSKQRNFGDHERPTLSRGQERRGRPKSAVLPSAPSSTSFTETLSKLRKRSHDKKQTRPPSDDQQCLSTKTENCGSSDERKHLGRQTNAEQQRTSEESLEQSQNKPKRGSRVMAAVAAYNDKSQELDTRPATASKSQEAPLDPAAVNNAFEELLDSRNIPSNVRDKMRSLDTKIKADFVKKETSIAGSASSTDSLAQHCSPVDTPKRPSNHSRTKTDDALNPGSITIDAIASDMETRKKTRPRSLTFTRSKNSTEPKKERPTSHSRTKSTDATGLSASTSSGNGQTLSFINRTPKAPSPGDYISYLQKVRQPQVIEVGRIQKLRQLLRNETISWVDTFTERGGMTEVLGLLYRIMEVEWREEHEDTLLHEVLLCLKALCTTTSALHQLADVQPTLFPSLLGMLFDKEKKGPSEFSTRGIIVNLLFTYLSTLPLDLRYTRARTLLSYLRDPAKPEEAQPPGFISSIYQPRPYRTWCNELVSITKEVFWIFLHHTNIVPYPLDMNEQTPYTIKHFPGERPPVPAAPYIGGVEWDATNYLAAHMDLLNGLVASLPTVEERNSLRQELRDSGFEKCMGASLRTCKEKFYGAVHAGLSTWIGAAREDGWEVRYVKEGPRKEDTVRTPSPRKRKLQEPPKLDMPKLDLGGAMSQKKIMLDDDGWL